MKRRFAMLVVLIIILTAFAVPVAADSDSTFTQGYWKNHVDAWNDGACPAIGEINTQSEWLGILRTPPRGDPWLILAHQYIAAYLNGATCEFMGEAAGILNDNEPGEMSKDIKSQALWLANYFDAFNNNEL